MLPYCPISHEVKAMKFGQMMMMILFFKSHAENEAGRLVPDLFLFFKKALYEVEGSGLQLNFNIFRQTSPWHIIKKLYQTLNY